MATDSVTLSNMNNQKRKIRKLYDAIYDLAFGLLLEKQPKLKIYSYGLDYGYYTPEDGIIEICLLPHLEDDNFWAQIADTLTHELTHALQDQNNCLNLTNEKTMHDKFFKQNFKSAWNTLNEEWNDDSDD